MLAMTSEPVPLAAAGAGPVAATVSDAPVTDAWAEAGQSSAPFGSTWQPVSPAVIGETVAGGGAVVAVVAVVVVVDDEVVVEGGVVGGGVAALPLSGLGLRPHHPLLSSSRSASLPQPLLPSRSASIPPVQPGLSAPPLLIPSGSEGDRPWV